MDFNPAAGAQQRNHPPEQCPLALEHPEAHSNLKSVQLLSGDLCAVLIWQLTFEFSCALSHGDIFLPISQPSTDLILQWFCLSRH